MLTLCRWILGLFWSEQVSSASSWLLVIFSSPGHCCRSLVSNWRFKSEPLSSLYCSPYQLPTSLCLGCLARSAFDLFFCIHPLSPSSYAEDGEKMITEPEPGFYQLRGTLEVTCTLCISLALSAKIQPGSSWGAGHMLAAYITMEFTMPFPCGYHRVDTKETGAVQGQSFEVWLQEV